jgi:hypothetical protein
MTSKIPNFFVCSFCSKGWHDLCKKKYAFETKTHVFLVKCNCDVCNSVKLDNFLE